MAKSPRQYITSKFEAQVAQITTTLEAQDRVLERLDKKMDSPVLNGGFEDLMQKVERIEGTQAELRASHDKVGKTVESIHVAIYDPDRGLYAKVKDAIAWIARANWVIKGMTGVLATGALAGVGKLIYDFATGHIHYSP